jgi:uncharacterized SAM-binding protein YcdF (DUF218 family)
MFFIASKLLYFLLSPLTWILLAVVLRWRAKLQVWKRRWGMIAILLLVVFTNTFIHKQVTLAWQTPPEAMQHNKQYSAAILLGGLSYSDKERRTFFGSTSDRFIQAARLWHTGTVKKIIVCGGVGNLLNRDEPTEGGFMRDEMIAMGIPDSCVLADTTSKNTFENALQAKAVIDAAQLQPPYVLVTSAIHMPRSLRTFAKAGLKVEPHPSNYEVINSKNTFKDFLVPDVTLLDKWTYLLKEMVGLVVYSMTGKA